MERLFKHIPVLQLMSLSALIVPFTHWSAIDPMNVEEGLVLLVTGLTFFSSIVAFFIMYECMYMETAVSNGTLESFFERPWYFHFRFLTLVFMMSTLIIHGHFFIMGVYLIVYTLSKIGVLGVEEQYRKLAARRGLKLPY